MYRQHATKTSPSWTHHFVRLTVGVLVLAACGSPSDIATLPNDEGTTTTSRAPGPTTSSTAKSETTSIQAETFTSTPEPETTTVGLEESLCTSVNALPDELYVSFEWETGESRELRVEFTRSRPGTPALTAQTPVTLTAVDVTNETTSLLWEYGETRVAGISDPQATAILTKLTPPETHYVLNGIGEFEGITNIEELRNFIDDSMSTFETEATVDPSIVAQLRSTYGSMSDEQFTTTFAEEIVAFHTFDGMTATVGESWTEEGLIPSPFGGPPFQAAIELVASAEFDSEGCAVLSLITIPDPETTPQVMREVVGNLVGEPVTDEELFEDFNVRNEITLQLDVATSEVRRITTSEVITTFGQRAEDIKTITYLD